MCVNTGTPRNPRIRILDVDLCAGKVKYKNNI